MTSKNRKRKIQGEIKDRQVSSNEEIQSSEELGAKNTQKFEISLKNKKFLASIPFILAILIYVSIWVFEPGEPVVDPWFSAVKLVDSSQKVTDTAIKKELLSNGGNELRHLAKIHPYHARVRFFLGYYYFVTQNWDSAMTELKEAARLDSGSTINSIWPNAHDLITKVAINKSIIYLNNGNIKEAKDILLDAYKYYPSNPLLNKQIGSVCFNTGDYESAFRYFSVSAQGEPNDADVINMLGVLYKMKGDIQNARVYFQKALQINPNHPQAKVNLVEMNN